MVGARTCRTSRPRGFDSESLSQLKVAVIGRREALVPGPRESEDPIGRGRPGGGVGTDPLGCWAGGLEDLCPDAASLHAPAGVILVRGGGSVRQRMT